MKICSREEMNGEMVSSLYGKTVAFMIANGFNGNGVQDARDALEQAGCRIEFVAPDMGRIRSEHGWNEFAFFDFAGARDTRNKFDALYIPDGKCADLLRRNPQAIALVQQFFDLGRPVAAMGRSAGILLPAGIAGRRRLTSSPTLTGDFLAAGAFWVDAPVVTYCRLVTGRDDYEMPQFLFAFMRAVSGIPAFETTVDPMANTFWRPSGNCNEHGQFVETSSV
jgi:protease I